MAGRPRVPTALQVARGNPGKRPLRNPPGGGGPLSSRPPPGLEPEARAVWKRTRQRNDYLRAADSDLLATYCRVTAALEGCKEADRDFRELVKLQSQLASKLAISPVDREKVVAPPQEKKSPLEDILERRRKGVA